jgi:transposase
MKAKSVKIRHMSKIGLAWVLGIGSERRQTHKLASVYTDQMETTLRTIIAIVRQKHRHVGNGTGRAIVDMDVLLPRRWVVERSFAWAARFRRLARDYERLPTTLAGYHWLAFVTLMLGTLYGKS